MPSGCCMTAMVQLVLDPRFHAILTELERPCCQKPAVWFAGELCVVEDDAICQITAHNSIVNMVALNGLG